MSRIRTNARKLFSPLLDRLENSAEPCVYAPRSRLILWVMSLLFMTLGSALAIFVPAGTDRAFLIPVSVFCLLGAFGIVVAWLGSDQAVARVWRNR